jgi:serine/threonine protein kinase
MPTFDLPRPFGPYTLLRRLAAGGMAEVYLGRIAGAAGFEKLVAIKRIHPHHAADGGFSSMLLDEAKLSVTLSHRNIVQTLDLGCVDGAYVLVMEHVEGYDMHHVLDRLRRAGRSLPVGLAAHVIAEVCRGLDYAHCHRDEQGEPTGIVHRDVSPQNVLLSFAGEVKIADFGIAKASSRRSDPESGVIKGKYFYMSPEQAWAEPLDHRSDIFSAGILLWELLVGERLHQGSHVQSLLDAVRRADVPAPSSRRKEVPGEMDAIVARATAANPAERYADAGMMADALLAYLAGQPPIHASRQIGEMLAGMPPPSSPGATSPAAEIPQTRDRVATQSAQERRTPSESLLRYDLDEGRPTVAGWRSPKRRGPRHTWLWALGAGSLLVGLTVWLLFGP